VKTAYGGEWGSLKIPGPSLLDARHDDLEFVHLPPVGRVNAWLLEAHHRQLGNKLARHRRCSGYILAQHARDVLEAPLGSAAHLMALPVQPAGNLPQTHSVGALTAVSGG
jgi:hypothetical protein